MPDDIAGEILARPATAPTRVAPGRHWRLLDQLESTAIGERAADGSVTIRRNETAGCFLYGPYLHLPQGHYRLSFHCRGGAPRLAAQPVLGVEVIVLSRFQQAWQDFTAADLSSGAASLDFAVPRELSLEGENEGRFEFRFFHLGNADLTITAIELDPAPAADASAAPERRWRLLGRLQKGWIGRRTGDGVVRLRRIDPGGRALYGSWPYLRLPHGAYRLLLSGQADPARAPGPLLRVTVIGDNRWRSPNALKQLARLPETGGVTLAMRDIAAAELVAGSAAVDFTVPTELALEAGADAPFDIRIDRLGAAALTIDQVELVKLDKPAPAAAPEVAAPRLRPAGRRKIVMVGNCQSETLRQGFAHIETLNRRFEVKYHFVQLPNNLREFAARDLETCDILLIQDIRLWDEFPLRDRVRPGAEIARFPLVRFASLWPFDAWNGPGDRQAHDSEAPNLTFPYLDGLLGRLRREIPDAEARFQAYRDLSVPGLVNYRRLHQLEERRLAAIDRQFGVSIGSFILENYRRRRVFHTTVRPNWEVFSLLLQYVAKLVGVTEPLSLSGNADAALRNPQVPVHPKVAHDLGVVWADSNTRYLNRGREMTWETYIRSYIEHYG